MRFTFKKDNSGREKNKKYAKEKCLLVFPIIVTQRTFFDQFYEKYDGENFLSDFYRVNSESTTWQAYIFVKKSLLLL